MSAVSAKSVNLRAVAQRVPDDQRLDPRQRRSRAVRRAKQAWAAANAAAQKEGLTPPTHMDVAVDLGIPRSTFGKYLREPDEPEPRPRRAPRAPRWPSSKEDAAVEAWLDRHGRLPRKQDWSPGQLRRRQHHPNTDARIAAWKEGWIDAAGTWQPFPWATSIAFDAAVDRVAAKRGMRRTDGRTSAARAPGFWSGGDLPYRPSRSASSEQSGDHS